MGKGSASGRQSCATKLLRVHAHSCGQVSASSPVDSPMVCSWLGSWLLPEWMMRQRGRKGEKEKEREREKRWRQTARVRERIWEREIQRDTVWGRRDRQGNCQFLFCYERVPMSGSLSPGDSVQEIGFSRNSWGQSRLGGDRHCWRFYRIQVKDVGTSLFGVVSPQEGEVASECFQMVEPIGCVHMHGWAWERVGMGGYSWTHLWRSEEDVRCLPLLFSTIFLKTEFLS